jgi:hypothetical protein
MIQRVFLGTAIPFGIGMLLMTLCMGQGKLASLLVGVVSGAGFGLSMTVAYCVGHRRAVEHLPFEAIESWPNVVQVRELTLDLPFEPTFDACLAALTELPNCRILSQDRLVGTIVATRRSQKTWGDTVTITLHAAPDAGVAVHILSRPARRTTVVDYGSNLENVEMVLQALAASSLSGRSLLLRSGEPPRSNHESLLRPVVSAPDPEPQQLLRPTGHE